MQEALHRMDPAAAKRFADYIAQKQPQARDHTCALCKAPAVLCVISAECNPPVSLSVCEGCAPEYLRRLADVIAEEAGCGLRS